MPDSDDTMISARELRAYFLERDMFKGRVQDWGARHIYVCVKPEDLPIATSVIDKAGWSICALTRSAANNRNGEGDYEFFAQPDVPPVPHWKEGTNP